MKTEILNILKSGPITFYELFSELKQFNPDSIETEVLKLESVDLVYISDQTITLLY